MLDSNRLRSLKDLAFHSDFAKRLWITISHKQEDATKTGNIGVLLPTQNVDNYVEKSATALSKLIAGANWPKNYLPIRAFRSTTTPILGKNATMMTFLSSGTTSGPQGRSKSPFSVDGVTLYRGTSLLAFADMLKQTSGHIEFGGVSLVPPVSIWSDSSLARMIHWLSECWDVGYADYLDAEDIERSVYKASNAGTRPVFVFGTAFHLIDFLDQHPGHACSLPPGSIVIETGGTKGRTRSVTRPELYSLIANGFGITEDRIVSEYGMCELASQAYDFVKLGETKPLDERTFRFPTWAPVKVMREHDLATAEGEGALLIWDQARFDVAAPIQVEDLVKLYPDGSFQLIGRIPTAPLKGCSLKVDDILDHESPSKLQTQRHSPELLNIDFNCLAQRCEQIIGWLRLLTVDSIFMERLAQEFSSKTIATQAVDDLNRSLPRDAHELASSLIAALAGKKSLAASWILIPPSTHSIAALQPLALLLAANVSIKLRLTRISGQGEHGSSLTRIFDLLTAQNFPVSALPPSWKIKSPEDVGASAILIFGDDSTIAEISQKANAPVTGFGNALAATLTYASELQDHDVLAKLVRDNISLSQRGCMSSRINFIIGDVSSQLRAEIKAALENALQDKAPASAGTYVARSLEIVRLKEIGGCVERFQTVDGLVCFFNNKIELTSAISHQEMNFIFQIISEKTLLEQESSPALLTGLSKLSVTNLTQSLLKATPALTRQILSVPLGTLNVAPLNGFHFGIRIFS